MDESPELLESAVLNGGSRGAWKNPLILELVTKLHSGKWEKGLVRVQFELGFRIRVDLSKEQLKLLGLKY